MNLNIKETPNLCYDDFSCWVDTRCSETTKSSRERFFESFFGVFPCMKLSKDTES